MTPKPISVQLYSLREQLAKDFDGTLKAVADAGYAGVEPAGFYDHTPAEFRKKVEDLGMKVSSSHSPWCTPDNISEVVDVAGALGVEYVCCGYGQNEFATLDAIKATAEMVNGMAEKISAAGLKLMQHNHWWEFDTIQGRLKYDVYAELCPKILFELDMYWVANFGFCNPAEQIRKLAARTPYLHVKDGSLIPDQPLMAGGTGKVDIPAAINAADDSVLKWLVVELDFCATDMVEAVTKSCAYLKSTGLGVGK